MMPDSFGDCDMSRQIPMSIANLAVHFTGDAQYIRMHISDPKSGDGSDRVCATDRESLQRLRAVVSAATSDAVGGSPSLNCDLCELLWICGVTISSKGMVGGLKKELCVACYRRFFGKVCNDQEKDVFSVSLSHLSPQTSHCLAHDT
jgi:hypothetical protein